MMPSSGGAGPGAASLCARQFGRVVVPERGGLVFGAGKRIVVRVRVAFCAGGLAPGAYSWIHYSMARVDIATTGSLHSTRTNTVLMSAPS